MRIDLSPDRRRIGMLASPASLVCPVVRIGVALTILAIAIGRGRSTPGMDRRPAPPCHHVINAFDISQPGLDSLLLDARDGGLGPLPGSLGYAIENATCSPWVDDRGRSHVVGRWKDWHGEGPIHRGARSFGLARFTLPDGELLDHVALEVLPASRPCWFPGTTARVLFACGDGRLYRHDFDSGEGRPRPLAWRAESPAPEGLFLSEPTWPTDPRLGGRLVATGMVSGRPDTPASSMRQELWWLQLDPAGTAIVAAGPLSIPDPAAAGEPEDQRMPSLTTAPDGTLVLAYLTRPPGRTEWRFRLARVAIDPRSGDPSIDPASVRTLARGGAANTPRLPGGRWVYLALARDGEPARIVRFDVAGGLGGVDDPASGASGSAVAGREPMVGRASCG
jgi:hypothetical protein